MPTGLANSAWPKFGHDSRNTGQSPYNSVIANPQVKWSYTTGAPVGSSPSIAADGTVYIGSNDYNLYAVTYTGPTNATGGTGTVLWSYTTGGRITNCAAIAADGTIYIGSGDHKLYAFSPTGTAGGTGTVLWSYTTGGSINGYAAIAADGTIYVGSQDDTFYAFSPTGTAGGTGTLKWSYTTGTGGIYFSCASIAADGTIYVGSQDHKLYAFSPTGTAGGTGNVLWSYTTGSQITGSPAIAADGTIYVGSQDDTFYAFSPTGTAGGTGTLKWSYTTGTGGIYGSPAIAADGTIYISSYDQNLYAFSPTGTVKWSYQLGNYLSIAPVVAADGTIYICSTDNNLYAFSPTGTTGGTGNVLWSSHILRGIPINTSPAIAADGTIYIGSGDYNLYAITGTIATTVGGAPTGGATGPANSAWAMMGHDVKHTGQSAYSLNSTGPSVVWSYKSAGAIQSSSVIGVDGTVYVGWNDGNLYAFSPTGTAGHTGIVKWSFQSNASITATPAIANDGTIYVGSQDNTLYALTYTGATNATGATGIVKWSYVTGGPIESSPIIGNDGTVYVGSNDNKLYAFYPAGTTGGTGVVNWSYNTTGIVTASPAIGADGTVYIGSYATGGTGTFYAIQYTGPTGSVNGTGTALWAYADPNEYGFLASPVIGPDGTIYIPTAYSKLYAFSPTGTAGGTGIIKWSIQNPTPPFRSNGLAIGLDGTLYIGDDTGSLYGITYTGAINTTGGTGNIHVIQTGVNGDQFSYNTTPIIQSNGGALIASSSHGAIYQVSPITGNIVGSITLPKIQQLIAPNIYSSPSIGTDGTIYIGSFYGSTGTFYAFSGVTGGGGGGGGGGNTICFLKGTYILTTDGEVLVEDLTENHIVVTHGNIENEKLVYAPTSSRVKNMIHFTAYNLGQFSRPICFKQGVAGHMTPNRDLYISPLHMVLVGDKMYQAHQLVNGTTIAYDMTCSSAEYYHIVLEKHSVIFSNNLATESCSFVELRHEMFEPNPISASNILTVS